MLFLEKLKPMKIYRKPMFLPTVDGNKRKKSAIFLLTPNYESSKALMTSELLINKLRFASYYIEKDLTYFISSKVMSKVDDVTETYVHDYSELDFYHSLCEMSTSERNKLKDSDFGLPKKRKYPLTDKSHVKSAIKFFNYVDSEDEAELAKNLNKVINKFYGKEDRPKVGEKNRFSKYYHESISDEKAGGTLYENTSNYTSNYMGDNSPYKGGRVVDESLSLTNLQFRDVKLPVGINTKNSYKGDLDTFQATLDEFTHSYDNSESYIYEDSVDDIQIAKLWYLYPNGLCNAMVSIVGSDVNLRGRSEVLIVKENKVFLDLISKPGKARIPGGGWNEEEDHAMTAVREAQEEAHITCKNIKWYGNYVRMYDTPNYGWLAELPKEEQFFGDYNELYVAEYGSPYRGEIAAEDKDSMYNNGKWYDILENIDKLNPKQQEALRDYLETVH